MVNQLLFVVRLTVILCMVSSAIATHDVDVTFTLTIHSNGRANEPCSEFEIEQVEEHLIDTLNSLTPAQLGISDSPYASFEVFSLQLDNFMVSQAPDRNRRLSEEDLKDREIAIIDSSIVSADRETIHRRLYGYWFFGGSGRCSCCYCKSYNGDHDHYRRGLFTSFGSWYSSLMNQLNEGHGTGTSGSYIMATSSSSSGSLGANPESSSSSGSSGSVFHTSSSATGSGGSTVTAVAVVTPDKDSTPKTASASSAAGDGTASDSELTVSKTTTETSTVVTSHSSATNTLLEEGVAETSVSEQVTVAITLAADLQNELSHEHCMAGYTYTVSIDFHDL